MRIEKLVSCILSAVILSGTVACGSSPASVTDGSETAAGNNDNFVVKEVGTTDASSTETSSTSGPSDDNNSESGSAASVDSDVPSSDISLLWEDSCVFPTTSLGQYYVMPTYEVKGYQDVPFVKASDYLDIIFAKTAHTSFEDGILIVSKNGTEATIDPSTDTIYFENPSLFRSSGMIDGAIMDTMEMNVVTASVKNTSTQTDPKPLAILLADYNMPVIVMDDDLLMPFLALQNTFGAIAWSNCLAYNGKDYYNVIEANSYMTDHPDVVVEETPFLNAVYSGPFSEKASPSQDYANYSYFSTCLLLDLYYGHKEEKNITTFDEYFTRINAKPSLCSTDISTVTLTETLIFFYLFDSGHDAYMPGKTVFGDAPQADEAQAEEIINDIKESEEGSQYFGDAEAAADMTGENMGDALLGMLTEKGFKIPELAPMFAWTMYFDSLVPEDYGSERIDYVDDTAVIYFDAFKDNPDREPSIYLEPMTEEDFEDNNFAFFYSCFEEIKEHKEIKNVVINISSNGGGDVSSLIAILGFLSKDGEVTITNKDMLSDSYREECYHVDTNLDGIADDNDGYGGQYDFFIMASPSSYSCANALPYFAQQAGLATIIGTKPGGGDCVVGEFLDAYGCGGAFSGMLKLGKMENEVFVSNESATEPDLNMMPSLFDFASVPWLNPEGITDAVHQYKDGATQINYGIDQNIGAISNIIMNMLTGVDG